jgi:hypothetical protein
MSMTSKEYQALASADRAAANETTLPMVRQRLRISAERWDMMADRQLLMEQSRETRDTGRNR